MLRAVTFAVLALAAGTSAVAQGADGTVRAALITSFYKLSDDCRGHYIAADMAAPVGDTMSETEVIGYLSSAATTGTGLLIVAPTPTDRANRKLVSTPDKIQIGQRLVIPNA